MTILISSPATDGCLRTVSFCSVSWMTGGGCCCGCCGCCCCCSCWPSPPPLLENELRLPLDSAADRKLLMSGLSRYQTHKTSLNQNLNIDKVANTIKKKNYFMRVSHLQLRTASPWPPLLVVVHSKILRLIYK